MMNEYKIIYYNTFTNDSIKECFERKIINRYYKTLLYVNLDTLTLDFDNVLKAVMNGCFDGVIIFNTKRVLDMINIDLFIKYMKRMPKPYDTEWEFYIRLDKHISDINLYTRFLPLLNGVFYQSTFIRLIDGTVYNRLNYPSSIISDSVYNNIISDIISKYKEVGES